MSKLTIKKTIENLKGKKLKDSRFNDISCIMLYYGRKWAAEEAMESFLRQSHPHKKLIIVNTHPSPVWFEKEYPNVEVHNLLPDTFENLNEKYVYALAQVKTKWWAPWDSDDIWLPHHLKNLVAYVPKTLVKEFPRKIGISRSYFMFRDKHIMIGWAMWSTAIWETFDRNGNRGAKVNLKEVKNCDRQILYGDWNRYWLDRSGDEAKKKNPLSTIFRWNPKLNHNRSAVLGEKGIERADKLREDLNKIVLKEPWRPHWNMDYVERVKGDHETFVGIQPK